MRALLLLPLAGCWVAATPAPVPPVPQATSARCVVHESRFVPAGAVVLAIHGMQFAHVDGAVGQIDVIVKGTEAEAQVENNEVLLAGELELEELPVRPRQIELRDGWLEISRAIPKRARKNGSLEVEVSLPTGVSPQMITLDLRCDQLTFALPPPRSSTPHLEIVELVHGTTRLRQAPDGRIVATAAVPPSNGPDASVEARVIERRDSWVHLRISGTNAIAVWVPNTSVSEPTEGFGPSGFTKRVGRSGAAAIKCTKALPLYVQVRGQEQQVGTLKANAVAWTHGFVENGRVGIELGGRDLAPYIKDLASCTVRQE